MIEKESLMLGNFSINVISEEGIKEENLSRIFPYIPGSVLNNWTAEDIQFLCQFQSNVQNTHVVLSLRVIRIFLFSDINDTSNTATDSEFPFE
ncbi:trans-resveratrol di-O-methyltransferase-like [Gossypium australe]|uniref:Trans-resveratrol di-O-methyltransferase-like n=1 Tax=Gossypium australe TaxID=47621 RepID=A0A5B6WPX1_9ROSI|nr:trans-resveratrol di-O-methyltransferase-like [Gossypium australe]